MEKKRLLTIVLTIAMSAFTLHAQNPSWAKKAASAVFTLKTFRADGSLLASSNGFFTNEDGIALSCFAPFKGAERAVIIDAQGKEWPVESLIGANEMYDVAKFQVAIKKSTALPLASAATKGATVWMMPYSAKKTPDCQRGTVSSTETFQDKYLYYTLSVPANEQNTGCPVLDDNGQVLGLLQPSTTTSTTNYAVSALFVNDIHASAFNATDPTLRSTAIDKALPDSQDEALLALYMSASAMDNARYENLVDRFIQKFPDSADGYINRARILTAKGSFEAADKDMKQALSTGDKKDDVHYQYAQLIYQKEVYQSSQPYPDWSLDRALSESQEASRLNPQPVYRQQQAQILYAQKKYDEAYTIYNELTTGPLRSAEIFYAAAQCKLQTGDRNTMLALLDSAVNTFTKPYVKTAAPFLLARAQALHDAGKYRPAVSDYNEYEALMASQLTADFYYLRHQAEVGGHLYQQALDDIKRATEMAPQEALYWAEKASLELRVGMTDEALKTAKQCISTDPGMSDGYLFLGVAQCVKGQKSEGLQNLSKAKELGNSQAQSLIDKYSK